ncbi:SpoIIE family protein phosphatase [Streptomyces sp. NPDC057939]|uniref:SpoIIE family protein phosphatase n=1 Tax=Streptomyces sp. NPDC057939 TaxID=3346284 RepID=UPI0036E28DD9
MPEEPAGPDDPAAGRPLETALHAVVRATGASTGMLYLAEPAGRVLHLALTCGVARDLAAPWSRVWLDDRIPVADAVRDGRLVWLGGREETARRYPRLALVLPYAFALAAAPLPASPPPAGPATTGEPPTSASPTPTAPPPGGPAIAGLPSTPASPTAPLPASPPPAGPATTGQAPTPTAPVPTGPLPASPPPMAPASAGPATTGEPPAGPPPAGPPPAGPAPASHVPASPTPTPTGDAPVSPDPAGHPTPPRPDGAVAAAGLVLLWPGSHAPLLEPAERDAIDAGCRRLAQVLREAEEAGRPIAAAAQPVIMKPPPPPTPGPVEAAAGLAFVRRLPGGSCALDLNGRITFLTTEAAELLGAPVADLIGALPWEALPWMDTPVIEDHYRAAAISRMSRSFVAVRPPDRNLRFELHPDGSGISVRITAADTEATDAPDPDPDEGPHLPSRATALYQLMHLAATLTEAAHAQDVVDQAADQLVPALGAQAMALLVVDEQRLRIVGFRGYTAELMARFDGEPMASGTATTRVLRTGSALFYANPDELLAAYPTAVIQDGMSAWAFLPLIASGRPVGSLVLAYRHPHPFVPGERAVLTALAGLIAQALDRARLYDSTHRLARSLQTNLLPHTLPRVPGLDVAARYLPAAHGLDVGGDFYDLIRVDGATVAATIGDVQGHNVNAAALMGQVRTAVHATAGAPPGEVLARTNRLLTDLDPGLFTSCLYVQIDLARHTACLATAGHPPPLLQHPTGPARTLDLSPGILLGIDPDAVYESTEIPFPPGTLLALYTDGLVETPGRDLDSCIREAAAHLSQARPVDDLADGLVAHAQHVAPRTDDIALLLLRRAETAARTR